MGLGVNHSRSPVINAPRRKCLVLLAATLLVLAIPLAAAAEDFIRTGFYTGDGSPSFTVTGLGFQPDFVIVKAATNEWSVAKTIDMPAGLSKKLADNRPLDSDRILTLDADGFTVGTHNEVNEAGVDYHWVAMKSVAGSVHIGHYVGNGFTNREVTMPGIFPDAALIISDTNDLPVFRHTDMDFWEAYRLDGTGEEFNSIGWFNTDAIYLGTDHSVNEFNQDYYYVAWQGMAQQVEFGNYWGNGGTQDITSLGMNPDYLFLANNTIAPPVHRTASLTGDATLFFINRGLRADHIQAMWDGGFQVGSDNSVNNFGTNYFWLAFSNVETPVDLQVSFNFDDTTPNENQTLNYSVDVTNLGPGDATGVQVTYQLPFGLTFQVGNPDQGTYDDASGIWDIGNLVSGQTLSLSLSATVDVGTGGSTLTNFAAVTGLDQFDSDPGNNSATENLSVLAATGADLAVTIEVDDDEPVENEPVQFTVTLTNNGPDPATGIVVMAFLPPTMNRISGTPTVGGYSGGSGWWDGFGLAAGETQTLVLVGSPKNGQSGNTITVDATVMQLDQIDPNSANDIDSVDIYVAPVDLQVTKLVNNPTPDENAQIIYTVILSNVNSGVATGITVSDYFPTGVTFVSATATAGTYDQGTEDWTVTSLAPAQTEVLSITGTVNPGTGGNTITNIAGITAIDQNELSTTNNQDEVDITVNAPGELDLGLTKTVNNSSPDVGEIVVYTVTVFNPGPDTATGIEITDLLPAEVTFVSAMSNKGSYENGTGLWTVGDLDTGFQAVLDISALVETAAIGVTVTNSASITAVDQADPDLTNNDASADFTVPVSDLQMSHTVSNPTPEVGEAITYTVKVFNAGPSLATGIQVDDLLPAGVTFVSATPDQGSYDEITGAWDVGNLNPALEATLIIDVTVELEAAGTTVTNSATVTAVDQADSDSANNTATADITVAGADLALGLVSDVAVAMEGDTVNFTLTVQNTGPADATGINATQLVPAGLTFQSSTPSQGSYDDGSGTWTLGDLASGVSATLGVAATVDAGTTGDVIANTAAITASDLADPNTANDSDSVDVTVVASGDVDLQLAKTVDNPVPGVGQTVAYTVTVANPGPTDATGVAITDFLPAEVSFVSALTNKGSYDEGTGLWDVGNLDAGYQAELTVTATVLPSAVGSAVTNTAAVTAADQPDPNGTNNTASVDFNVPVSDLQMTQLVDIPNPNVGDTVVFTVNVLNLGPDNATGVEITDALPVELTFVSAVEDQGAYDDATGIWTVGNVNSAQELTLTLTATVRPEAAGSTLTNAATVTGTDQADPTATNDSATADITVAGADLQTTLTADTFVAFEGQDVNFTFTLANNGPDDATGVAATQLIPAGLTFQSATPSQGSYNEISGLWTVGDLANAASATLDITVTIDAGTAGSVVANLAVVTVSDPADPDAANNTDTVSITVPLEVASDESFLWPLVGTSSEVLPGAPEQQEVLTFAFVNRGDVPETLHSLTVTNLTAGGGTLAQMDAEWQPLHIFHVLASTAADAEVPVEVPGPFVNGKAVFAGLEWAIPAGDTITVTVTGAPSLQVRDAADLTAGIAEVGDLAFSGPYTMLGSWPLVSGQTLQVNGFVAAQAAVVPRESGLLSIGSEQNLALTVDLPGNGYLDDALYSLSLKNSGSAEPGTDITRIEAWADDGDGNFDPLVDTLLGPTTYSGERWQLTGLNVPVPATGRRFYATVDIAETAQPAREVRLGLPVGNGDAVEMYSGNDGPVDEPLENPNTLGISVTDRIILTAEWFLTGVALPGTGDVPLCQFVLTNTYSEQHQLQSLTFTNTSIADGANNFQRDALFQQVDLRLDANLNGELDDLATDPALATGFVFFDGRVTFSGLNLDLDPDSASRLFVTADLGLMTVADGNRIKGEISSIADISIPTATIVSPWPLSSGVDWLVNGMTAAQITTRDISVMTLGPGEGPVLAMDLTVPSNGYATDELIGISFTNEGSAGSDDLLIAELWQDGGDGVFGEGGGDDLLLGPLTLDNSTWNSTVLSRPIPLAGLQLFTSLTVAAAPNDSVTVDLNVPTGGITVSSGNDGPLDQPAGGSGTLIISTSPLRTSVTFARPATNTGQAGTINMAVRNAGSETVADIVPTLSFVTGDGLLTLGSPTPAVITSLDPAQETTVTWSFTSVSPGEVVLEGNVQGLVNGDQVRRSIVTPTSTHRIFTPVPNLELYPTANLPFSINRGQQGLVPLTLTFINPGDAHVANAQLTSLKLRLMETEAGPDIIPAELLDQVIVSEGTNVYLATSTLPTSGSEIDLVFSQPVVITGAEPVTLGLRLDLRLNSTVPSFLISIEEAGWLVGNDAIDGSDLEVIMGAGAFPVRTGQANLVAPAAGLDVAVNPLEPGFSVPGQTDVLLAEISLFQSDTEDNSSTIDVGRLAFKFHGSDGRPLANPAQWFSRLSLQSSFQEHFSGVPVVESDSLVVLQLSAPVTISGSATLVLRLMGDLAEDSPLGRLTPILGSVDNFDARDGNMNNPVPVNLTTGPEGSELSILGPATGLEISGTGTLPLQISQGTRDLTALDLVMTNPGASDTTPTSCDTMILEFYNAARQPLDPTPYLDRIRVLHGDLLLSFILDPTAAEGVVALPLGGLQIEPGQSAALQIRLDLRPDAPTGTLEVVVDQNGFMVTDAVTGALVAVQAGAGTGFPFSSGVGTVVIPADELTVAGVSLMPPLLAPQAEGYPVMSLEITNPAGEGSGGIEINNLVLRQEGPLSSSPTLDQMLSTIHLLQDGNIIAAAGDLEAGATTFTLSPDSLLIVNAGQTLDFVIEVILAEDTPAGVLQLGLHLQGVVSGPPGGEGVEIRVLPASGEAFPFITEKGNIGAATLADSYLNFPNPFAAGQESTTFAFNLPQDGRVNLRLVTPHGELVAQILQDEARPAGFYQSDLWFGLNGNGVAVRNGVYLAELVVDFSDGSRQRILRKVAVVR